MRVAAGTVLGRQLSAAFEAGHAGLAETTRRQSGNVFARMLAYLCGAGCVGVGEVSAGVLNAWVASAPPASGKLWAMVARRVLGQLDPADLHPSLLVDGKVDWTPRRATTSVPVGHGHRRAWVDPGAFPAVPAVAGAMVGLLARLPLGFSPSSFTAFASAVRSLLGWLDARPAPPLLLEWVTADLLDAWVADLSATRPRQAQPHGTRIRDLLANRPAGVRLHRSLLAADGVTLTWLPEARLVVTVSQDLPFATLAAVRDSAAREVRDAVARVGVAAQLAATGADPGQDPAAWRVQANVWRAALDGRLDAGRLQAGLGDDPAAWPDWLRALVRAGRPARRSWPVAAVVAVVAVHAVVFPTALEVTAAYVQMLTATGLPPESVMTLESSWFLVPVRPGGGYGPVGRLRYEKDRAGSLRRPLLYSTRTPDSPVRVRDRALRLTGGLRALAGPGIADRLWLVGQPLPRSNGRAMTVTTLDRIRITMPEGGGTGPPFSAWVTHHGLADPDRVAAWNTRRADRHAVRLARREQRLSGREPLPGLPAAEPFRAYTAWPGRVTPQRVRKTVRVRDIVLHGPHGAARDHTTRTLLAHYTASQALRVVAASAVRDAQGGLAGFAADPAPRLLTAATGQDTTALAGLLGAPVEHVQALLTGGAQLMRNGLVCTAPATPPAPRQPGADGVCQLLGAEACRTCPAVVAAPAGVPALWQELRRTQRTAHVRQDNPAAAAAATASRQLLLDLLAVLDPPGHRTWTTTGQPPQPPPPAPDSPAPDTVAPPRRRARP